MSNRRTEKQRIAKQVLEELADEQPDTVAGRTAANEWQRVARPATNQAPGSR
jgi:hypothetical protein